MVCEFKDCDSSDLWCSFVIKFFLFTCQFFFKTEKLYKTNYSAQSKKFGGSFVTFHIQGNLFCTVSEVKEKLRAFEPRIK